MRITRNVRDYATKHGIADETAALVQGRRRKAEESRSSEGAAAKSIAGREPLLATAPRR